MTNKFGAILFFLVVLSISFVSSATYPALFVEGDLADTAVVYGTGEEENKDAINIQDTLSQPDTYVEYQIKTDKNYGVKKKFVGL